METDEPPPNNATFYLDSLNTIKLNNGQTMTPGEAWTLIIDYDLQHSNSKKSKSLYQRLYDHFHPHREITTQEHSELLNKLTELEQKRDKAGKKVFTSENPDLYKTPEFQAHQQTQ